MNQSTLQSDYPNTTGYWSLGAFKRSPHTSELLIHMLNKTIKEVSPNLFETLNIVL